MLRAELEHLPSTHTTGQLKKYAEGPNEGISHLNNTHRAKFWDPTWSSKPWKMGGEGFFCHIKWIFCFCSSHCLFGCFVKLVPVLSCVSFLIQTPCPMLCWLSCILFCEPPTYLVLIHFLGGWSICLSSTCYHIYRGYFSSIIHVLRLFLQVECYLVLQNKCLYSEYIWKVF